jgi:SAM-dependent methyltransferase
MDKPKYPKYQDYVIRDGRLVGEFERMYQDYENPWDQAEEHWASDKAVGIHLMRKLGVRRILELGCGLGQFTGDIAASDFSVLGVDVSATAIAKARLKYPACGFRTGDILDFDIYRDFRPDLIVMAEITWYVLDKLDRFLGSLRKEFRDVYLLHLLVTYPPGVQRYGAEKFSTLPQIMDYFGMEYLEWGELRQSGRDTTKTYFLGRWPKAD